MTGWKRARWRLSHIGLRLLAFNILVAFVPIVGVLYLDVYESRLLDAQERAMVQQGRILAAAIGETEAIDPASVVEVLRRLGRRNDARLRIFDRQGALIADSAASSGTRSEGPARVAYNGASQRNPREDLLYRIGAAVVSTGSVVSSYVSRDRGGQDVDGADEADGVVNGVVAVALRGRYGAATRATRGERSVTLYSAVPVQHAGAVIGTVVVSQSSFRILQALYDVRLRIFRIIIASLALAALLTMVGATTIVKPLTRLRRAATSLAERRTSLLSQLPGVHRRDEIGELARALQDLTHRLNAHIGLLEGFAADVAHEFKNPLAGIRSAAETIDACEDPAERSRFVALMIRDVNRLEQLVSGLRELAHVDRHIEDRHGASVNVTELVRTVSDGVQAHGIRKVRVNVHSDGRPCGVAVDGESLAQVFENLLTNAISFAPEGSTVDVHVSRDGDTCCVSVADRGPGVPEAHRARVFDRFFTYRPSDGRREHLGLGLAIAKRIVDGHGGEITVASRDGGGAVFEVRLRAESS
jgi:two-component system, OmpR family, sensor histidine kinase ChvG